MLIGHLKTDVIERREPNKPTEGGFFEIEINIPESEISAAPGPWAYVSRKIAEHLAHAIDQTSVPREFWILRVTPETKRKFNLPFEMVRM